MAWKPGQEAEWEAAYTKEKEENAALAVKGLTLEQPVIDFIKRWWTETESDFAFQRLPAAEQNRRRKVFYDYVTESRGLKPEETKQLERLYKPSFLRSFKWAALEALPSALVAEKPGIPAFMARKPGKPFHRPPEEALKPMSPAGEIIGTLLGDLPTILPSFKLAGAMGQAGVPLLKAAGAAGRAFRAGTAFGLADVPKVIEGKRDPEEIIKSAALGMVGFGPAKWYMKAGAAGIASTLMAKPEEAAFTGIRAVDIGLPTAALFGGLGALEKVRWGKRTKRGPSPQQQLESELKGYAELEPTEKIPFFQGYMEATAGQDEARMIRTVQLRAKRLERRLGKRLRDTGHEKLADRIKAVETDIDAAARVGNEELLVRKVNVLNEITLEAEVALGAEKSAFMLGGNAEVGLSKEGLLRYTGRTKTGPFTGHTIGEIQKRPIIIDRLVYEGKSDVKGPKGWSPRDEYMAVQAYGHGRAITDSDLRLMGYTREKLPELIRELRSSLSEPRAITRVAPTPTTAATRKLTEIENSGLPASEKKELTSRVNAAMESQQMKIKAAIAQKKELSWSDLDENTTRNITQIGASFEKDPADPLYIATLFERKGIAGRWNSKTGKFQIKQGKTYRPITIENIEALPEAGDVTLKGELVITSKADTDFNIVKRAGKFVLSEKKPGRKGRRTPYTYDEIRDILYSNKGIIIEYKTPDGGFVLRDIVSGKQSTMAQAEVEALARDPGRAPKNLTPGVDVKPNPASFDSGAAKAAVAESDVMPRKVIAPLRRVTPKKYLFDKYQAALDVPVRNWWRETETVARTGREWLRTMQPKMRNLSKTLEEVNEDAIMHYVTTPSFGEASKLAKTYGFKSKDFQTASIVRDALERTFGPKWRAIVTDYIPEAIATGEVASTLRPWVAEGLNYQFWQKGVGGLYEKLSNAVFTKARLILSPQMEALAELKKTIREANFTQHTKKKVIDDLNEYISGVSGTAIADKAVASDFFMELNRRLGTDVTGNVADQLISIFMLHSYAATMGLRMNLTGRNFTQIFTTGVPVFGVKNVARGLRRSLTPKGIKFTRSVIGSEFTGVPMEYTLPESAELLRAARGITGKVAGRAARAGLKGEAALREAYRLSMLPYKGADWQNRNVMCNTAWVADTRELPGFRQNRTTLQEFKNKTGIVYFNEATQQEILAPLRDGFVPANIESFLKRFAVNAAEDTQWIYRAGAAASVLKFKIGGVRVGRLFGQFGTWPLNYLQWVQRGISTGNLAATEQFVARWLLMHAAMAGAGAAVGINTARWLFFAPMAFTGGPAVDLTTDLLDVVDGGYKGEAARRRLARNAPRMLIPFSYLYNDAKDAYEMWEAGELPWKVAMRAMGWRFEE